MALLLTFSRISWRIWRRFSWKTWLFWALAVAWPLSQALLPKSFVPGTLPYAGSLRAPALELRDREGQVITLESFQGHPVVVNFWATWCIPCRTEMPNLAAAYAKYRESQGLVILAVHVQKGLAPELVESFARDFSLPFPVLLDREGTVERAFGVQGLPTTIWIDRQGRIQNVVIGGPMPPEFIEGELRKIF